MEIAGQLRACPEPVGVVLYYSCAETLSNVVKHARASKVSVTVEDIGSRVVHTGVDDGRGGADPSAGTGLRGLGDRVEALGGRRTVSGVVGKGTVVGLELPLPAVG